MRWKRNYKADLESEEYAVFGYRLYDDHYYGPEGMWDMPESRPMDSYMLKIYSWHPDLHNKRYKVADELSNFKLSVKFKDKDEANRMWLALKHNKPTLGQLIGSGKFHKDV